MMDHGDFSPSSDPEDTAFHCTPGIIPIVPVRFSLLPYENLNAPTKPTAIGAPGDYIVRMLRRGFVYIFIEQPEDRKTATSGDGLWYVFRHSTDATDANSDVTPANTQVTDRGNGQFIKYEWTDSYGEGEWTYSSQSNSHCWVPDWASRVWIAFSEYRWPPAFFRRGHDAAFRSQLMVQVNLRGQNEWAAYAGEALSIVEEFKPEGSQHPTLAARLNLSQTGFQPGTWNPAVTRQNEKCVAVVAVHDVMGDIEEMSYRLQRLDDHQKRFSAAHAFPLTIGQFCKQLAPSLPKRDGFLDVFNGPALEQGWEMAYGQLHDIQKQMLGFMDDCTLGVCVQLMDEGNQMLGKHLALAFAEAEKPDELAAEYGTMMLGRALQALSFTAVGSSVLRKGLGANVKAPEGAPDIKAWLEKLASVWGALQGIAFDRIRKTQYSFHIAFEAVAVQLATEVANGGQPIGRWQDAIETGFREGPNSRLLFGTHTMSLDDATQFLQGIPGNYDATVRAGEIAGGDNPRLITRQFIAAGPTADIPFIRTETTIQLVGGVTAERRIAIADMGQNALGLFAASWALFSTAYAHQKAGSMIRSGRLTTITSSHEFQLAAATASVADALKNTYTAARATQHSVSRISAAALETLYNGRGLAGSAALVNAATPATTLGRRLIAGAVPRIALVLGTVAAIGGTYRGIERQDTAETVGNALMLIGGLLLIPGLGWVAAGIGAVVMAVGFLISLSSYDAMEDVVRLSFWGSSNMYWDRRRPGAMTRVSDSRDLPPPYDAQLKEEIERFGELTWKPVITNPTAGDKRVLVQSAAIEALGINDVEVTVRIGYTYHSPYGGGMRTRKLNHRKERVGNTDMMIVSIDSDERGNMGDVEFEVKVRGPRSGIEHETTKGFPNP